jgi:hypothetical protein
MNWNELWIYVKTRQVEYVDNTKIPPREKVIDEPDSYDIVNIGRLSE